MTETIRFVGGPLDGQMKSGSFGAWITVPRVDSVFPAARGEVSAVYRRSASDPGVFEQFKP